ncbi:hypothetical protein CEV33_4236 [Brucella grignonensis]|uniref:Uncharacterized protein n=1 Tax=Brucella grignonensis TaxID=94627 RepID=A0A256FQT4_9HYPH|nr:hypothetical protein CEV33_4236 [Brucella grignonensis]
MRDAASSSARFSEVDAAYRQATRTGGGTMSLGAECTFNRHRNCKPYRALALF